MTRNQVNLKAPGAEPNKSHAPAAPVFDHFTGIQWEAWWYRGFEILLEPWGDGNFNIGLCDMTRNAYDWGMLESYVPHDVALKDAVSIIDVHWQDPEVFYDEDEDDS